MSEDTISRKAAIDSICRTVCDNPEICESPCDEVKILENMPSVQPETHEERTETHACDCISRQAAVDAMGKAEWAKERLRELPSAQPDLEEAYICGETEAEARYHAQQRWIPCSERLPEQPNPNPELEGKPLDIYLVCKQGNIPFRAFWNGRNFADGWTTLDVDAWMPLPEPYKEGEG